METIGSPAFWFENVNTAQANQVRAFLRLILKVLPYLNISPAETNFPRNSSLTLPLVLDERGLPILKDLDWGRLGQSETLKALKKEDSLDSRFIINMTQILPVFKASGQSGPSLFAERYFARFPAGNNFKFQYTDYHAKIDGFRGALNAPKRPKLNESFFEYEDLSASFEEGGPSG